MALSRDEIVRLDKAHVWHPYTSIDAWEKTEPLVIARGAGSHLFDADGTRYLDGNSSWYSAILGHGHPRLHRALREQLDTLDHCALAGIAHEPSSALAAELVRVAPRSNDDPPLNRVFYTDDGSTAIEVAVKIAIQKWQNEGATKKTRIVALDGAYHGDTLGASSLGDVGIFKKAFAGVLFECVRAPFPEPGAHEKAFATIRDILVRESDTIAAVFVEPIVQGTSGMRIYDAAYLAELRALTRKHDVLLVVDEVFTGYGRTGRMWACEHAAIVPDMMCIGKGFTSIVPMGATLVNDRVFDAFRGGADKTLWYGHTLCGNPIGAALAREVLAIFADERIVEKAQTKAAQIAAGFERIGKIPGIARTRSIGMIGAADFDDGAGYLGGAGWRVYEEAKKRGAYLRPLGDTVYVTPPLTIEAADLGSLLGILEASIHAAISR